MFTGLRVIGRRTVSEKQNMTLPEHFLNRSLVNEILNIALTLSQRLPFLGMFRWEYQRPKLQKGRRVILESRFLGRNLRHP
jgi:hypothetical protein